MKRSAIIVFLLIVKWGFAQDVHFSQYYNSPQMINPAMIGEGQTKGRLIFNFRNQGSFMTNPYKTMAFSGDAKLNFKNISGGFLFLHDKSGDGNYSTNNVCLSVASAVQLNKEQSLKLGFQTGWMQYALDADKLTWNSQFDGTKINQEMASGETIKKGFGYFDLSTGLLYTYRFKNKQEFHAGFSAFHITHSMLTNMPAKNSDVRWCGFGEALLPIKNSDIRLMPSVLYMKQGTANEFAIGTSAKCKIGANKQFTPDRIASFVYLGTYYRSNDAIMMLTGLSFQEQMIVSASYDIPISAISEVSKNHGGIEFSVIYIIQD